MEGDLLTGVLQERFEKNPHRHKGLKWEEVLTRLEANPNKLRVVYEMEKSGGEPDVIEYDKDSGEVVFGDCSPESPAGRRSLCYDRQAWETRKEHKPKTSAVEMAEKMGIELFNEEEYRKLQSRERFDTKTSSWIKTPGELRKLGGALFGDRRYERVFVYHNGAESYYAARGFRGKVKV